MGSSADQKRYLRQWVSILFPIALISIVSCGATAAQQKKVVERTAVKSADIDSAILDLKNQITEALGADQKPTLVIIDFVDQEGRITGLGRYLSEELLSLWIRDKKLRMVERRYLEKTMDEINFGMSGLVSDDAAKSVGKLVGADAILTGSYSLVGERVKIQARIVDVETGQILAAGSAQIDKSEVAGLLRKIIEEAPAADEKKQAVPRLAEKAADSARTESITTEGVGSIRAGDEDIARDNALDDALRQAVEQGMGVYIESETLVENFQLVNEPVEKAN